MTILHIDTNISLQLDVHGEDKGEKSTGSTPQRFEHEVTRYDTPYLSSSLRRSSVQSLELEHIDIIQSAGVGVV